MNVKEAVLEALEENRGTYLSGEKLSEGLGVSRAAVWKAIARLREEGYPIEAVTRLGYLLPMDPGKITADEIRRYLPAKYRNNGVYIYDVLDSTNNRARQIAADGATPDGADLHGSVVIALQQTAGKGRLGRGFHSPREGLYLSIIVKPDFDLSRSVLVTVAAAEAVARSVDEICGVDTGIKWVNDVYLDGKKICGILTEGVTDFETGGLDHLVIGIGVNTTMKGFPRELQKIAGAVEGDYSRSALAADIVARTLDNLEAIEEKGFMEIYREKDILTGQQVQVYRGAYQKDPQEEMKGDPARVMGIDENGGLMVMFTDGTRETLTTGEVTIRL